MELLVEAFDYNHALMCIKSGVKNLVIGNEVFATRISYSFNESEVIDLVENRKNTNIWIKVNKIFFEQDLKILNMYLRWLSKLDIKKVIFQDFAVAQIIDENEYNIDLHYNPETIVTSYGQFDFYKQNNINSVFIAREIMMKELEEICSNKNGMEIEIQGFGYGFIMHSRWPLISNFQEHYHIELETLRNKMLIRENLRKYPNVIFEDEQGTHMLTGYLINLIGTLPKLNQIGIDYLQLNFLKLSSAIATSVTNIFNTAISDLDNYDETKYEGEINEICKQFIVSKGFLGGTKSILHLEKEEQNE